MGGATTARDAFVEDPEVVVVLDVLLEDPHAASPSAAATMTAGAANRRVLGLLTLSCFI